jgi:pullulanase
LALTEEGTRSPEGIPTGIDHLKELGITHVHLLPSYDYASVDEHKLEDGQYNWGYDPLNYNVPDGSYSTDPYAPEERIREFKQMVQALHKAGIRVVLDVVFNHTFNTEGSNFERTVPGYFYRMMENGEFANASGCGNETASERPMMRRYMIESVRYWMREYHIDGFRFDLMGIHDIETMNAIREAARQIDPQVLIYGEGWAAATPQLPEEQLAMKANISQLPGIAAFSDEMRDGLRGPWNNDSIGAFLAGITGNEESIKFGLVGAIEHPAIDYTKVNYSTASWAMQPSQMISYVSCHDDMCLVDRLRTSISGLRPDELSRLDKLAQTAVLTSQGIPFIFAGEEVMRDKKGVHNSFESPDSINTIDWHRLAINYDVFNYYKNLIALRKHHVAFHMGDAERVRSGVSFLPVEQEEVIAYRLQDTRDEWKDIIVVLNARKDFAKVEVPGGRYVIVCRDGTINEQGLGITYGPVTMVPPQSALIMYLSET